MDSVHVLQIAWFVLITTISGVSDMGRVNFSKFGEIKFEYIEL